jgi:hypothetical protein
MRRKFTET